MGMQSKSKTIVYEPYVRGSIKIKRHSIFAVDYGCYDDVFYNSFAMLLQFFKPSTSKIWTSGPHVFFPCHQKSLPTAPSFVDYNSCHVVLKQIYASRLSIAGERIG